MILFFLLFWWTDPAAALIYGEDIQRVKLRNFNPTLPKNLQCKRPLPISQQNRYQQSSRIINGQRADWNWPFIVRIKIQKNRSYCGASIINPEYVITAAHCVAHDKKVTLTFGDQVLHEKETRELSMDSAEFIIHPRYSPTTGQNDIALIKLPRPIAYSSNISPVCLPYKQEFQPGTDCFIAGWGAQDESHKRGVVSSQLMEARVPLLSGEGKGYTEWIHQQIYDNNWRSIYDQYKPNNCGSKNIGATEMSSRTEASTILVTSGDTKCFGTVISENFVIFAIDCVTDEKLLKIFSVYDELTIKKILYDDYGSLAMVETVETLEVQMCVSESTPGTNEECLSLDSEYFPNFYRTSPCPAGSAETTCFDNIPSRLITNMLSVPIICGNRLVSFYLDTESIQFMSLQQSRKTITAAIEKSDLNKKPQIAPEENVMVTYEYQYDYTEVDGEETAEDFQDYESRGSKKNRSLRRQLLKPKEQTRKRICNESSNV
ncbi:Oidioi.mRNA.OKI2018_I69.chr2.g7437.t1.cds [Oikopleura dioica]|uniref:Oidioi.mRNA.OKI2018_I69.chr2.g7437.t1.cds n=1 Tax=Oikopleura dioica TaxID=34765 RepID=A0ABN7T9W0_OIKDI|nr:Oidioi.mRNA.OKI2018_I69.chr2.g7437.t1.cds [Oikopleura dioica]